MHTYVCLSITFIAHRQSKIMASELYKALEGHEMVIAAVLALLATVFMIFKDKKVTMHVNPCKSKRGESMFAY